MRERLAFAKAAAISGRGSEIIERADRCCRTLRNRWEPIVKQRGDVVVLHFAGQMPLAGIAWQAIHYLIGLERLGYRAWYVEDGGANPFDPFAYSVAMECEYNVRFLQRVMEKHGFGERWSYWDAINDVRYGRARE